jgi:hypothetical protein
LGLILISPVEDLARDLIVAVSENIRFHDHFFTRNALNRESPAINLR